MRTKINLTHRYFTMLSKKLSEKQLMILIAFIVGIASAFTAYFFEIMVSRIRLRVTDWGGTESVNFLYLIMPLIGIILVTLFVKYVIRDNISHGVTRILYAITHKSSKLRPHNIYSSIIAGATTIGFGGSVGPEAPIVMTGAAVGSNIARFFRMNYRNTTILLGCGVAGALAGIFKAPITGVVFVLEVLMISINMTAIIPVLIAAVTSTSIIYVLHGFEPIFSVNSDQLGISVSHMPYYLALAVLCGFVAFYLIYSAAHIETWFKRINKQYVKWLIGGTFLGLIIFIFPPLYGQGYNSINDLINANTHSLFYNTMFIRMQDNIWVLLAFLIAIIGFKPLAMACTNAAGGVGGAFAPSLFLGAFTGFFTATLLNRLLGLELPVVSFTLVGMAGVMSGAMNSPLTAIFLIAEITGGYKLFVPLMLVSAISFTICYYFSPFSVYTRELVLKGDTEALNQERSILFIEPDRLIEDDFSVIHEDMTLGDMIEVVAESKRNVFPVISFSRELIGIVTLDDIRADMFNRQLYDIRFVSDYMSAPPQIIRQGEPVSDMLLKFDESGAWNLPVVNADKKYLGFISKSKIFSEYRNSLK